MPEILRYWVFTYDTYYPAGGMRDFLGAYNSMDAVIAALARRSYQRYHVFDSQTGRMVRIGHIVSTHPDAWWDRDDEDTGDDYEEEWSGLPG